LCPAVSAQQESLALRTLAISPGEFPQLWAMSASKAVKLEFSTVQPSEIYQLSGANPLPVYVGPLGEKGLPSDKAPAMLKLPASNGVLLLGWMQGGLPKFMPIPDMPAAGKYNDWAVINATAKEVALQIGISTKPVILPAGSNQALRIDAPAGQGTPVIMASKEGQNWQKFFSTYWPVQSDQRCLIVVFQTADQLEAKQIFENLDRSPPQKKTD